jgi:hypothetical protein
MDHPLSRRATLVGALAVAGTSAVGGLAISDGFALAADETLFVGFIKDRWPSKSPRAWHKMVRDDGSDERLFHYPCDEGREGGRLVHGARVWAACYNNGINGEKYRPSRILQLEPADSIVSFAARKEADTKACRSGQWVNASVLLPNRHLRTRVLIRCHRLDVDDPRWLHRTEPVGPLATAKAGDRVQVKFGKTWDGWKVFEAKLVARAQAARRSRG